MTMFYQLDFEKPVTDLEQRIKTLRAQIGRAPGATERVPFTGDPVDAPADTPPSEESARLSEEIATLEQERETLLKEKYKSLSPWDTVRVARHPARPQTRDYIDLMCSDFCELHGDRRFGDDPAIVTGFARIGSTKCLVVGHQKGKTTAEKIACHFGCAHPEGYRKALAKMQLAAKYGLPIVTLVDTPGAFPGIGAEERGQAEAIAVNLREMARLETPIVTVVIGEGGSGGALGIAVADRVAMLQHAWYSVISPEGCAAILWKQANEQTNNAAAASLRLTAKDNKRLGIIDTIIPEPIGGAHRDPGATASHIERWITEQLHELKRHRASQLPTRRYDRFRKLGEFDEIEVAPPSPPDQPEPDPTDQDADTLTAQTRPATAPARASTPES